jgi:integration host factor subunit beta
MTRADLTDEVARATEIPRKESDFIVTTILDSIVRALRNGNKVEVRGFGSFRTRGRRPRRGRNPKTGAGVDVPAKTIPYFKPNQELKNAILNSESGAAPNETEPAALGQNT